MRFSTSIVQRMGHRLVEIYQESEYRRVEEEETTGFFRDLVIFGFLECVKLYLDIFPC